MLTTAVPLKEQELSATKDLAQDMAQDMTTQDMTTQDMTTQDKTMTMTKTKTKTMTMTKTMIKTFGEHLQIATPETFGL